MHRILRGIQRRQPQRLINLALTGRTNWGFCPICEARSLFAKYHHWLRDHYRCVRCWSIPRERAIVKVLQDQFPNLGSLRVFESSPGSNSSIWISENSKEYLPAQYFSDVEHGEYKEGVRCENLEDLTFEDSQFDIVVTQDVMEHVLAPANAFREIARILKPGGAHVFTVPLYAGRDTLTRAQHGQSGEVVNLAPPEYHGNPIDPNGSLVATEWGEDLQRLIEKWSMLKTDRISFDDPDLGLQAEFLDVFVSRKSANTI